MPSPTCQHHFSCCAFSLFKFLKVKKKTTFTALKFLINVCFSWNVFHEKLILSGPKKVPSGADRFPVLTLAFRVTLIMLLFSYRFIYLFGDFTGVAASKWHMIPSFHIDALTSYQHVLQVYFILLHIHRSIKQTWLHIGLEPWDFQWGVTSVFVSFSYSAIINNRIFIYYIFL